MTEADSYHEGQNGKLLLWLVVPNDENSFPVTNPVVTINFSLAVTLCQKAFPSAKSVKGLLIEAPLELLKCDMHTLMNPIEHGGLSQKWLKDLTIMTMGSVSKNEDKATGHFHFDVKHWDVSLSSVGTCFLMATLKSDSPLIRTSIDFSL